MSFNAIRENKILAKIFESTVFVLFQDMQEDMEKSLDLPPTWVELIKISLKGKF